MNSEELSNSVLKYLQKTAEEDSREGEFPIEEHSAYLAADMLKNKAKEANELFLILVSLVHERVTNIKAVELLMMRYPNTYKKVLLGLLEFEKAANEEDVSQEETDAIVQ